jgi:serine/threonine protein kinase
MAIGAGDRIGQYVLCREIGRGGMGTVYEAEHVGLGKRVALKRMHPHLATDATGASRFLREGRAATQIRSPHVVEVFDVGKHENVPYLVMELLNGVDLAALLRMRKKLEPSETADLMVPIASAVHAAHLAGVVHRDLKPGNILLAEKDDGNGSPAPSEGRASSVSPIILDFGISKFTGDMEHDLTASEVLLGTVHYMSPEQTRGGNKATPASDQYALGVMLYECLTGAKPFSGSTPYAVMHAIVSARVVHPSVLDPSLPPALDDVVLRAMSRDPKERFPSVQAFGAALLPWASLPTRERHAVEFGVTGSGIAVQQPRQPRASRRRRFILAVGLGVTTAVGIGALSLRSHGEARLVAPVALPPPPAARELPVEVAVSEFAADPPEPVPAEPAEAAPAPSARPTAAPRATARSITSAPAPTRRPERGANGALIVE